ncbi:MAG: hypothetical protein HKO59_00720 [Phycisphaerales bacterium]|nr:hypothetical protein [Phycisphaerae bacterium]NNM24503.1 hypothetical protein [Phycisphaerales bacterium]
MNAGTYAHRATARPNLLKAACTPPVPAHNPKAEAHTDPDTDTHADTHTVTDPDTDTVTDAQTHANTPRPL